MSMNGANRPRAEKSPYLMRGGGHDSAYSLHRRVVIRDRDDAAAHVTRTIAGCRGG